MSMTSGAIEPACRRIWSKNRLKSKLLPRLACYRAEQNKQMYLTVPR